MNKQKSNPEDGSRLRQRAEEKLKQQKSQTNKAVSEADMLKLIHELQVHQIELELQNEELVIAKEKAELAEEKYTSLFDFAPTAYFNLTPDGNISELNLAGAKMLGKERRKLVKSRLAFFTSRDTRAVFDDFLSQLFIGKSPASCEVAFVNGGDAPIYAYLSGTVAGDGKHCLIAAVDITERKAAEEEIRFQAHITANSPVITAYHDKELNMLWANNAYMKATGLSLEEIKGRKCYQVWNLSKPCRGCPVIKAIETGENATCELTPDNQEHWPETQGYWLSQATPVRDAQGAIIGAIEFAIDITERKQAEEELKTGDRIFKHSLDMLCIAGFDGYFKVLNPAWTKILGWSKEELLSKPWIDFVHPDDRDDTKDIKTVIVDGKEIYQFENRYMCQDGTIKWLSWNSFPYPEENIMFGVARDVTVSKQRELTIYNFFEQPLNINIITDFDGKIIRANSGWEIYLGYQKDEIIGNKLFDFIHPDDVSITIEEIKKLEKGISTLHFENRYRHKNGEYRKLEWSAIPSPDEHLIYAVAIDITERKQAEKELIKAKEKAEESDRLKTAFINNISHEVRTPLNGILGFGHLIMEEGLSEKEKQEYYKVLRDSSKRLQDTISDIMDISQLTAGSIKPAPAGVHLGQLMNNMLEKTQFACAKRNILVTLKSPEQYDNLVLQTDGELLSKILSHLLNNAEKFTSEGRITLGFEVKDKWVEFFVSDTGKGIAADKLDAVFEPFMQEDASVTRGHEGSGLGLTIAMHVAELLGGKLWAESEKGKGSTFLFTLPYVPVEGKAEPEEDIAVKPTVAGKALVLIAEDEESSYLLMKTMVQNAGFVSLHAFNGAEAVELCREYPEIGLILMDIKMPVMDGLEATARIKAFRPDLPVIALTAHAQIGDRQRMLDAGCDEYMAKPVKLEALNAMIKKLIT